MEAEFSPNHLKKWQSRQIRTFIVQRTIACLDSEVCLNIDYNGRKATRKRADSPIVRNSLLETVTDQKSAVHLFIVLYTNIQNSPA